MAYGLKACSCHPLNQAAIINCKDNLKYDIGKKYHIKYLIPDFMFMILKKNHMTNFNRAARLYSFFALFFLEAISHKDASNYNAGKEKRWSLLFMSLM